MFSKFKQVLDGNQRRGTAMAGQNSGEKLAGIEGQVGEEQEEGEGYLSVVLVGTRSGGRVVAGGAAARG